MFGILRTVSPPIFLDLSSLLMRSKIRGKTVQNIVFSHLSAKRAEYFILSSIQYYRVMQGLYVRIVLPY